MKKVRNVAVLLFIFILLSTLVSCSVSNANTQEENCSVSQYEIVYYNYELSNRFGKTFYTTNYITLFDFSMQNRYISCYDANLNCYAIINRDNGAVMERAQRNTPYYGLEDNKCIYGGYESYYYVSDGYVKSINIEDFSMKIDEACNYFADLSEEIYLYSFEDAEFESNAAIVEYGETLTNSYISLCSASNRDRQVTADNVFYDITLVDAYYIGSDSYINYSGKKIGYNEFTTYDGDSYNDILFPLNLNGTCGIVAATMLLQYYERNRIVRTVPQSFYNGAYQSFQNMQSISSTNYNKTVACRVYNAINSQHSEVLGGSTFVSIKDAIKAYFNANEISGLSATSNIGTANLKGYIDNGDPALIFVSACTIYGAYLDSTNYVSTKIAANEGHVLYTFGYTKTKLGIVDEYICNAGWADASSSYTYCVSFVSKSAIRGNVKILY